VIPLLYGTKFLQAELSLVCTRGAGLHPFASGGASVFICVVLFGVYLPYLCVVIHAHLQCTRHTVSYPRNECLLRRQAKALFQSLFCAVVIMTNINWKWPTVLQIPCRKPFCSQSNRARSVSGKVRWLAQAESCSAWHAQNVSTSLLCRGLLAIQIAGDMNGNNELLHNAAASFVTNFNSLKLGQFHDILDSRCTVCITLFNKILPGPGNDVTTGDCRRPPSFASSFLRALLWDFGGYQRVSSIFFMNRLSIHY